MGKTYGEKPIVFRFEENGEEYMIGSEVRFPRRDLNPRQCHSRCVCVC